LSVVVIAARSQQADVCSYFGQADSDVLWARLAGLT
jgi:hypothetical protein